MQLPIKIKEITSGCMPEILKVGDAIDLITAEDYTFKCPHAKIPKKNSSERFSGVSFTYGLIDLGVVIELPKGFKADVKPRSSTFRKYGLIQANSIGLIDQSYCGPDDVWKFPALATRNVTIPKGTPIAQFEALPSQKATVFQKLRWLFSSGVKIIKVDTLSNPNRGGLGTGSDQYRTNKAPQK